VWPVFAVETSSSRERMVLTHGGASRVGRPAWARCHPRRQAQALHASTRLWASMVTT
jgi:hypothetical protein